MIPPDGERGRTFESVLSSRRMCRDYLPRDVADDQLDTVLRAALRGPAAGNTWALQLVVLRGDDVARYWAVTLPEARRSVFPWPGLLAAPVLILPYVDPSRYVERYSAPDKAHSGLGEGESAWSVPYWWVDGGAAVMAMLLAAESEGLGALFFGQFGHEESVRHAFDVPAGQRTLGTLALGYRAGDGGGPSRSAAAGRPLLDEIRHDGGW